jgi:hypothetical protein
MMIDPKRDPFAHLLHQSPQLTGKLKAKLGADFARFVHLISVALAEAEPQEFRQLLTGASLGISSLVADNHLTPVAALYQLTRCVETRSTEPLVGAEQKIEVKSVTGGSHPGHGTTIYSCGHVRRCRCPGGPTNNFPAPCPKCR